MSWEDFGFARNVNTSGLACFVLQNKHRGSDPVLHLHPETCVHCELKNLNLKQYFVDCHIFGLRVHEGTSSYKGSECSSRSVVKSVPPITFSKFAVSPAYAILNSRIYVLGSLQMFVKAHQANIVCPSTGTEPR